MAFLSNMFGSGSGLGFQASNANLVTPTVGQQAVDTYGQAQSGLAQQQAFLNALQAQNGVQNQSSVFGQQQALAGQLQGVANGTGPNPALAQLNQQTGNNVANQASMMAGQRGSGANPALLAQLAARQGAATQQQAVGQGATLQAGQQLAGMQALQGQQQMMGNTAQNQVQNQAQATMGYNQAAQSEQQNVLNSIQGQNNALVSMQNGVNSVNGGVAGNQAAGQAGLLGGVSSAFGLAHGGMVPHAYADGGAVQPVSAQGKFLFGSSPSQTSADKPAPDSAPQTTAQAVTQGFGKLGKGLGNGLSSFMGPAMGPAGIAEGSGELLAGGAGDAGMAEAAPLLMVAAHGGTAPEINRQDGGPVPGKAQVQGDSPTNDTVPAVLSPGEIVIPRSILSSKDPGEAAKQFVLQQLAKKKPGAKDHFDDGGITAEQAVGDIGPGAPVPEPEHVIPDGYEGFKEQVEAAKQKMDAQKQVQAVQAQPSTLPPSPQQPQNPQAVQQGAPDPYGFKATSDAYGKGLNNQMVGLKNEANAMGAQSNQEAKTMGQGVNQQQDMLEHYKADMAARNQDIDAVMQDYKAGHIDPNQYMKSMTTGGKVSTAIGLILGGIAGGVLHQENPAMKMLNEQIDRNVKGQQAEMDKKQNLLAANFKRYGNMNDAYQMTSAMQRNILADQIKEEGLKSNDPIVQARAQKAAGELQMTSAQQVGQMAMRSSLSKGAASGQMDPAMTIRMMAGDKAEPLMKDLQSAQNMVRSRDNIMSAFDQLSTKDTIANNVMSPLSTGREVDALREPLLAQLVKDSEGRITPQDVPMIRSLFPKAGDSADVQALKRRQMNSFITEKMNFPSLTPFGIKTENMGKYDMNGKKRIQMGPVK